MNLNDAMERGIRAIAEILAAKYPHTAWTIAGDAWPAGSHIRISWINGPLEEHVRGIIQSFEFPHLSGPLDLYATHVSRHIGENTASPIGAKFITYQRLLRSSGG